LLRKHRLSVGNLLTLILAQKLVAFAARRSHNYLASQAPFVRRESAFTWPRSKACCFCRPLEPQLPCFASTVCPSGICFHLASLQSLRNIKQKSSRIHLELLNFKLLILVFHNFHYLSFII